MGFDFVAESMERVTVEEIVAGASRVRDSFTGWVELLASQTHEGEGQFGAALPELPGSDGLAFVGFFVMGRVKPPVTLDAARQALRVAADPATRAASVNLKIGYERKGSVQTRRDHDAWSAGFKAGKPYLGHSATPSGAARDKASLGTFYRELAEQMPLPITVTEREDNFHLAHRDGGELFTSQVGILGENPKTFRCELPASTTADSLHETLSSLLDRYGSGTLFDATWVLNVRGEDAARALEAVRESMPKTARHDVSFSYRLRSASDLDSLRPWVTKGKAQTLLGEFRVDGNERGKLFVLTEPDGHRFSVELTAEEPLEAVERALGLTLERTS